MWHQVRLTKHAKVGGLRFALKVRSCKDYPEQACVNNWLFSVAAELQYVCVCVYNIYLPNQLGWIGFNFFFNWKVLLSLPQNILSDLKQHVLHQVFVRKSGEMKGLIHNVGGWVGAVITLCPVAQALSLTHPGTVSESFSICWIWTHTFPNPPPGECFIHQAIGDSEVGLNALAGTVALCINIHWRGTKKLGSPLLGEHFSHQVSESVSLLQ